MDHLPPDRGRPCRRNAALEARWAGMGPRLPGQTGQQETRRDPHGRREGRHRLLGVYHGEILPPRPEEAEEELENIEVTVQAEDIEEALEAVDLENPE